MRSNYKNRIHFFVMGAVVVSMPISSLVLANEEILDSAPLSALQQPGVQWIVNNDIPLSNASQRGSDVLWQNRIVPHGLGNLPCDLAPNVKNCVNINAEMAGAGALQENGPTNRFQIFGKDIILKSVPAGTALTVCGGQLLGKGYLSFIAGNPNPKVNRFAASQGASKEEAPYMHPLDFGMFAIGQVKTVGAFKKALGGNYFRFERGTNMSHCAIPAHGKLAMPPPDFALPVPNGFAQSSPTVQSTGRKQTGPIRLSEGVERTTPLGQTVQPSKDSGLGGLY